MSDEKMFGGIGGARALLVAYITRCFLLADGRLRAGWRLLLFVVSFLACLVAVSFAVARLLFPFGPLAAQAAIMSTSAVIVTWGMMRWLERQSFSAVGLALERESVKQVGLGFAGGIVLVGTITLVEWSAGVIEFHPTNPVQTSAGVVLVFTTVVLCVSAATEELLFRGYPFQRLVEGVGSVMAVLVSAGIFGLLHAQNPHATRLSILNTVLAGVLLSLAYLKTHALWLPIGFHFSWNWAMALVGFPVSGLEVVQMPWRAVPSAERVWLQGGNYGPEGGLIASVALTLGVAFLLRGRGRYPAQPPGQPPGASEPAPSQQSPF